MMRGLRLEEGLGISDPSQEYDGCLPAKSDRILSRTHGARETSGKGPSMQVLAGLRERTQYSGLRPQVSGSSDDEPMRATVFHDRRPAPGSPPAPKTRTVVEKRRRAVGFSGPALGRQNDRRVPVTRCALRCVVTGALCITSLLGTRLEGWSILDRWQRTTSTHSRPVHVTMMRPRCATSVCETSEVAIGVAGAMSKQTSNLQLPHADARTYSCCTHR
ncbi:hypothetical protein LXA43DRAFT_483439 [Ganoderma leucocontextum]|nr:hypothetical protein LXA43DRAFT_483439 [Ganoderma leucocontextum]